jgi:hypothetical protein
MRRFRPHPLAPSPTRGEGEDRVLLLSEAPLPFLGEGVG